MLFYIILYNIIFDKVCRCKNYLHRDIWTQLSCLSTSITHWYRVARRRRPDTTPYQRLFDVDVPTGNIFTVL